MSRSAWSAAPTSKPQDKQRGRTVLLVDDDDSVLATVGETMVSMGHTVITAHDGSEALHYLIENRSIDCLFTDVVMSTDMNGVQLMAAARVVRPGLTTLLASSYPRDEVCAMGEIPGDVCFIAKPYLLSDLHEQLYWDGGAAPRFHEPPSKKRGRTYPNHLWSGSASRTVLLGESWIHADTK